MLPVTKRWGASARALSLSDGFIKSLFSALRRQGSVAGPQQIPFIEESCAVKCLSVHSSFWLREMWWTTPSAQPATNTRPCSHDDHYKQFTLDSASYLKATSHWFCLTSFQILMFLSYPQVAITFSNLGWAHATYQQGPEWAWNWV